VLDQVEAKREIMLQRLAYVVREHRAMTEAMGGLGSPSPGPGADVMAIINGRQAQVNFILPLGRYQPVRMSHEFWQRQPGCFQDCTRFSCPLPSRRQGCCIGQVRVCLGGLGVGEPPPLPVVSINGVLCA
jgi:hypothetical protein